jgi:hypothetical protein
MYVKSGSRDIAVLLFLPQIRTRVDDQMYVPAALLAGKRPGTHFTKGILGPKVNFVL